ncbi:MAG: diguanylate cyclase [Thermodesulfobacteriota bacterium]
MKILVAEDDSTSRRILGAVLTKLGYDVVSVTDGVEAWEEFKKDSPPRIAVLDWMMPGLTGLEVCAKIRATGSEEYTYVVLLTSNSSHEDIVEGMKAGADDYIVKPFNRSELEARVKAGLRIINLQSELLLAKEKIRIQSRTDALTGIANRRAVFDHLDAELKRSERDKKSISIAMLDLDHFKDINDTYGHQAGDAILTECVARISGSIRPYDFIGRYGGEEFLLVLPGTDESNAMIVCERILGRVQAEPVIYNGISIPCTLSIGLATWSGREDVDKLIEASDKALYMAKEKGRNRVACF